MNEQRCSTRVYSGERADWGGHTCGRKAKVEVDGKWYCGIHNPESVAKRRKKQEAEWAEKSKRDHERWDREKFDRQAGDACRAMGIKDPLTEIPILVNGATT